MDPDRDVSTMMMRMFSIGGRDDFGRDAGARRSLLLDTVMQGRKRESHCRLLQMPAEILADIVDLLADDKPALASLALVNSDCRYLARSCQFAEIHFDYSLQAQLLLLHLVDEALDIALHVTDATTRSFPIGTCVRRVTFASRREFVIAKHKELYKSIYSNKARSYSEEQRDKLREEAGKHYTMLRDALTSALPLAMPNLEVLSWEDPVSLDDKFFANISQSSARHIKLARAKIDKPWLIRPPLTSASWPLRSLDLDVQLEYTWDDDESEPDEIQDSTPTEELDHPISDFFETLLQRCAPTLESLSWMHMGYSPRGRPRISLGISPLAFPQLRYLRLGYISLHPLAFSSLLSSPLKHLELPVSDLEGLEECLTTCEPFRDLQSLVVPALPFDVQGCTHVAEFVKRHNHVHKLLVHEDDSARGSNNQLDLLILPILAEGRFINLCCLSLAWGRHGVGDTTGPQGAHIPGTSLMALGTIVSLERLSLRAGCDLKREHQWNINHDELRHYLKGLTRLKMLALAHDAYPILNPLAYLEDMKREAETRPHLDIDTRDMVEDEGDEADIQTWERAHRNRMLTQAEAYAVVFPALEWVFCGQRPMGFRSHVESHVAYREAIPLTKERDDCRTFLKKTFGIYKE